MMETFEDDAKSENDCYDNNDFKCRLDFNSLKNGYLFGRELEVELLCSAYHRLLRTENTQAEFILISGGSGTGKTALARTIELSVTSKGGFFITGKCDQMQRPEPYAPIVAAFSELVHLILSRGNQVVERVRDVILRVAGTDGRLLVDMIPDMEKIIGKMEPCALKGKPAQMKLRQILRELVRSICSVEHPLVMLMDDLQWADSGSLEMLEMLLPNEKVEGLVVIGICRPNEVSFGHDFAGMLRKLEDHKKTLITHIELQNISIEATNDLISHTLRLEKASCRPLTDVVHRKTQGNVLFVVEFLQALYNGGVFIVEPDGKCSWDDRELHKLKNCLDVVDLILLKMKNLPEHVQTVLNYSACMGAEINEDILSKIMMDTDVNKALSITISEGMIIRDQIHDRYKFAHDRIQQAAYCLTHSEEQAGTHLFLGRMMLAHLTSEQVANHLFLVVNQFMSGVNVVRDQEEKDSIASLCYRAGNKAILSSDFKTAAMYLWMGIELLGDRGWRNQYFLNLELHNIVAETEYCSGNFEKMDMAIYDVLSNARSFSDKVWASTTKVYGLWARARLQESISSGLEVLDCLGETLPRPSMMNLLADFVKTKRLLRGKTDFQLINLPDIENNEKLGAMGVLNLLSSYTYIASPRLFPFIGNRMIRISLKYGGSAISAMGFVMYGLICLKLRNYDDAYRYGNIALHILEKYEKSGIKWIPRIHSLFYAFIAPFKSPLRLCEDKVEKAYQIAMETGDIEYASVSMRACSINFWLTGKNLNFVEKTLQSYQTVMKKCKQETFSVANAIQLQMTHNFMGKSADPLVLTGEFIVDQDEVKHLAIEKQFHTCLTQMTLWRIVLAYHFGAHELALELAHEIRNEPFLQTHITGWTYNFYFGMAALAMAKTCRKWQQKKFKKIAKQNINKLRMFSKLCSQNCAHMLILLQAELKLLENKVDTALEKYENAIAIAEEEGLIHYQALANELAGLALREHSRGIQAKEYLGKAISLYDNWGAKAKVDHMIVEHGLQSSFQTPNVENMISKQ